MGELARLNLVPHGPSYASIDATPLFLVLLGEHVHWTGDTALFEELRPAFDAALAWIDRYGDRNGNGFVDYLREGRAGPVNQGWKDSWDGVIDERGRLARAPIALVEVQAYVYRAWRESARLLRRSGDEARAAALEHRSVELQARVERDFWLNDSDCYALGLDHAGRPLAVVTSNPGHVLWARLAAPGHARAVARRLLAGDEFSGFGLRTLSASEHRYSPLGYHLGTVWPHDTAIAVAGLRRYGFDREADRLANGLLDAADLFPQQRLPEAFSGAPRRGHSAPRPYPEANQPQAWAAGSVLHLVHSLLGLVADAPKACLTIVRPRLPAGVGRLDLTGLVVGPDRADLHFERRGEDVLTDVGRVTGSLQVEVVDSWPEDRA